MTYLLVGRLFDATGDNIRENMVIAVEGERIKSVASAADLKIPPGANVIDLSQATVLPGPDRLSHPSGFPRRPLQRDLQLQGHAF